MTQSKLADLAVDALGLVVRVRDFVVIEFLLAGIDGRLIRLRRR